MAPFCWHTQDKRLTISPSLLGKAESNTGTYISLYQFVFWIMLALSYVIATDVINVRAALVTRWRHMSRHGSHITVTAAVTVTLIHKWTYCPRHTNLLSSAHHPIVLGTPIYCPRHTNLLSPTVLGTPAYCPRHTSLLSSAHQPIVLGTPTYSSSHAKQEKV